MSATTTVTTFLDCFTALLNRMRNTLGTATPTTTNLNYAKSLINESLHDLHIQQNWPWAERDAVLITHATYKAGTVAIATTTRTTVTGTSTFWNTAISGMGFNNARIGGKVVFSGETEVYTVSAVGSDTSVTLDSRYIGSQGTTSSNALSGSSYTYFEDEYALASDFWRLVDARMFSEAWEIPVVARQEFYRAYPRNSVPSTPRIATIIELGPSGSVALRSRIVLAPPPDSVEQIPYRYITSNLAVDSTGAGAANLSGDTDEPIIPLRYRHVLVPYAAKKWFLYLKDDQRAQEAEGEYVDLVRRMANDTFPERDHPVFRTKRRRYIAALSGPFRAGARTSRYSADSRFDELRDTN